MVQTCAYFVSLFPISLIPLVILILDIIAIVEVLKSRADPLVKLLWVLVIWFVPLLGVILYFVIGRRSTGKL